MHRFCPQPYDKSIPGKEVILLKTTRFFAGANTSQGFSSFYQYLALDSFRRVFILKGGPGVGKSTLIKKIAAHYQDHTDIDLFHCSADLRSLDGVYLHGPDVTILDGTAPHVVDPRLPGAVQQIVDLGTAWHLEPLILNRQQIKNHVDKIGGLYRRAYDWLAVAARHGNLAQAQEWPDSGQTIGHADAALVIKELPPMGQVSSCIDRQAFATAITSDGLVSFLDDFLQIVPKKIILAGGNRGYNNTILEAVCRHLKLQGIPALRLHCALQPQHLEHIVIPGHVGIFSSHWPHSITDSEAAILGFEDKSQGDPRTEDSIQEAVNLLQQARTTHLELEKLYIPNVDFEVINRYRREIINTIESWWN